MLADHVRRFNEGVRSGDFDPMLDAFAPGAELAFEGVAVGPFQGRDAIGAAYAERPPDDEVVLLGEPRIDGAVAESDYAWKSEGTRAGRMILTARDGEIVRLVVTFE